MSDSKSYKKLTTVFILFSISFGSLVGLLYTYRKAPVQYDTNVAMENLSKDKVFSKDELEQLQKNGILIANYEPNMPVKSPQKISGWVKKESYPGEDFMVIVVDKSGNVLGLSSIRKTDEGEMAAFEGNVEFDSVEKTDGYIYFEDEIDQEDGTKAIQSYKLNVTLE